MASSSSSSSTSYVKEIEEQLQKFGTKLLSPPSSVDELLDLIEKVEQLLTMVEQAPPKSMQHALSASLDALVRSELLHCPDKEVQVSVLYCVHEIARITAPDAPYEDEKMKEIFDLTVSAFGRLSEVSTRYYTRAAAILDTVARHKTCLVMLDLELDELVVEMFKHFLNNIRPDHPHLVFLGMETVMTTVIEEIEGISFGLLSLLLNSVRKENKAASSLSWKLGEKVITNCARKLKPYLLKAVKSVGIVLDDYSETVSLICRRPSSSQVKEPTSKLHHKIKSKNKRTSERTDATGQNIRRKNGQLTKIGSTMNQDGSPSLASFSSKNGLSDQVVERALQSSDLEESANRTNFEAKMLSEQVNGAEMMPEFLNPDAKLVGRRVRVLWPLDATFYEGVVASFDPIKKRHKVLYDDGDEEILNLRREHWEPI